MKRHADIELGHSLYTDNTSITKKVQLRIAATEHISDKRVLDLFAGDGLIWQAIPTVDYLGIEADKSKGSDAMIHKDNRLVIPTLDLGRFNIVDCDAYGTPYEQITLLFDNGTLRPGTVVIFTLITGKLNRLSVKMIADYGLGQQYKRTRVLYNNYCEEMFMSMLHRHGITDVNLCSMGKGTMNKKYGWFVV